MKTIASLLDIIILDSPYSNGCCIGCLEYYFSGTFCILGNITYFEGILSLSKQLCWWHPGLRKELVASIKNWLCTIPLPLSIVTLLSAMRCVRHVSRRAVLPGPGLRYILCFWLQKCVQNINLYPSIVYSIISNVKFSVSHYTVVSMAIYDLI
jgi:hypothetical protein